MILEQIKTLEIEHIGDTEDGYAAGIADESIPFVLEFMSTQLYSNPIGSLIREITSNCFDSHVEAGVEDPVIISRTYHSEEGYSIEFQDVGVGMSPERMVKVFSNYFSSTKRENNTQIGGFGIGSKTPLSYADLFYITTVHGGKEYEYIYHKGEERPTLESLLGYEETENGRRPIGSPTDKRSGTIIKIGVAMNDTTRFTEELKFQLAYFDNVYFKGWNISNNYDIYEGKYFKFRSDVDQTKTKVHICLGNVRYPIDGTKVKIPAYAVNMPVAVKFDIGELRITTTRESLRYTKEDVKKIEDKIRLAYEELAVLFSRDNPITKDILSYIQTKKYAAKIVFDAAKAHAIYVWSGANISKMARFAPLEGLPIKTPNRLFFRWKIVGYFDGTNIEMKNFEGSLDDEWVRENRIYCIIPKGQMSLYTFLYIQKELTKATSSYNNTITLIRKDELTTKAQYRDVIQMLGLRGKSKLEDKGDESLLGKKTKTIVQYNKVIDAIVREKAFDYSKIEVPEEWIADYKRSIIESTAAWQRKINNKVFMRNVATKGGAIEMKVGDLLKRRGTLIYGYSADRKVLDMIYQTMSGVNGRMFRNTKKMMIVQVAIGALKEVIHENDNIIYYKDFLKSYQLRKLVTMIEYRTLVNSSIDYLYGDFNKLIRYYLKDYQQDYDELNRVSVKYGSTCNYLGKDLVEPISELLVPVQRFRDKYDTVIKALKASLVGNINFSATNNPNLLAYLKERHIRLQNKFYLKSEDTLKKERIQKVWKQFCIIQSKVLLETSTIKLLTN